jgi:DNA-binding transcriptional MerR regulator
MVPSNVWVRVAWSGCSHHDERVRREAPVSDFARTDGSPGSAVAESDNLGDADDLQLGVTAVARRLGVAPATLRTWDRRYGLGPSGHTPGRHRRYTADDLARLDRMRTALLRGVTAAEAARYANRNAAPNAAPALRTSPEGEARSFRVGGGALPLGSAGSAARGLARAAIALDAAACAALLAESVGAAGVVATWDDVIRPVLVAVDQRWAHTGLGVEVEHLLSGCVAGTFGGHHGPPSGAGRPPVLLTTTPGEQHVLPVLALGAALAEQGVSCRYLGPDLPIPALVAAVRRTAPAAVVLWAQVADTADVGALRALPRLRPRMRTYVAGPGWTGQRLPPRVPVLESLGGACAEITRAVTV